MDMRKKASEYQASHKNGYVSKVTDYSFEFTTHPKENEKQKSCVFYESYFLALK